MPKPPPTNLSIASNALWGFLILHFYQRNVFIYPPHHITRFTGGAIFTVSVAAVSPVPFSDYPFSHLPKLYFYIIKHFNWLTCVNLTNLYF